MVWPQTADRLSSSQGRFMLLRLQVRNQLHYNKLHMKERRYAPKTQRKSKDRLPSSTKNLTSIKLIATTYEKYNNSLHQIPLKLNSTVSITPQALKDHLFTLIQGESLSAYGELLRLTKGWMKQKWKDLRAGISSRLTKLKYLLPSLLGESFSRIEKEILHQWKKNTILHGLQYLWSHVFGNWKFGNMEEMKIFYNSMREIVSKLSYMLFEPCLRPLLKANLSIQSRLYNYTAVEIITREKEWLYIVQRVIKPTFDQESVSFSENYDLKDLNARAEILDIHSNTPQFQETAVNIKKLVSSVSKEDIISSLKQYRCSLLKEIEENIASWREGKNGKKQVIVQKEDILSCVIYALVRYRIDDIAQTLKYLSFLWGNQMENVLGSFQVDCFRVDLQVAYSYLSQPVVHLQLPSLQKLEVFI